jgi:hypothetical protein
VSPVRDLWLRREELVTVFRAGTVSALPRKDLSMRRFLFGFAAVLSLALSSAGCSGDDAQAQWVEEVKAAGFIASDSYEAMFEKAKAMCESDGPEGIASLVQVGLANGQSRENMDKLGIKPADAAKRYAEATWTHVCGR